MMSIKMRVERNSFFSPQGHTAFQNVLSVHYSQHWSGVATDIWNAQGEGRSWHEKASAEIKQSELKVLADRE